MYRIRFERKAREQLDKCCTDYGDEICDELWEWLHELADAAEGNTLDSCSADFVQFLDDLASDFERGDLPFSLQTWKRKDVLTKIRALLAIIRRRRPPWQLRHAHRHIRVFLKSVEVQVLCEIDNVQQTLIVRKFMGLPGQ